MSNKLATPTHKLGHIHRWHDFDGSCHNNGGFQINVLKSGLAGVVLWLDILATLLLVFILFGIWLFRDRVFTIGNLVALVDLTMFVGIGSVLLFNIASP